MLLHLHHRQLHLESVKKAKKGESKKKKRIESGHQAN